MKRPSAIGDALSALPRIHLHISRNEDGWWLIKRDGTKTVRRCKGSREDAEACAKRYLSRQGSNIGILRWPK